ncbi:hypothetical protein [Amycolatopsis sp. MtRt-6]|uniref:hypothetical protein n=1 Tax=Amycolatopsis sp. MtRt-6 TaxID=2792782 RepID=UPI001F5C374C|nr:hypothetical protein [Amycolatopsis sp. MtRt-6]
MAKLVDVVFFGLCRCHDCANVVIDADTGTRIDALPHTIQVADRWHLRHGMCDAAGREVAAHSACWASAARLREGKLAETTLQRWHQIHDFLDAGVGLLDCSRRLDLALNRSLRSCPGASSGDDNQLLITSRAAFASARLRSRSRANALSVSTPSPSASTPMARLYPAGEAGFHAAEAVSAEVDYATLLAEREACRAVVAHASLDDVFTSNVIGLVVSRHTAGFDPSTAIPPFGLFASRRACSPGRALVVAMFKLGCGPGVA